MSVYVKGGTPLHGESKCESCVHAHIERGFLESEQLVYCEATYPAHRVSMRVRECSSHVDKQRQTLYEMKKMAWILDQRPDRKVGFVPAAQMEEQTDEIELILAKKKA